MIPQDLGLFIGQDVETTHGIGWLQEVRLQNVTVVFMGTSEKRETQSIYELSEVKPICRRMEDMTSKETSQLLIERSGIQSAYGNDWNVIKWLTSKGICPFDEWFNEGLVIEKVKEPSQ